MLSIIPDRLDRAAFEGFEADCMFFGRFRLFRNIGIAVFVVTGEVIGSGFAAYIAVDALAIDIKLSGLVIRQSVIYFRHKSIYHRSTKAQRIKQKSPCLSAS